MKSSFNKLPNKSLFTKILSILPVFREIYTGNVWGEVRGRVHEGLSSFLRRVGSTHLVSWSSLLLLYSLFSFFVTFRGRSSLSMSLSSPSPLLLNHCRGRLYSLSWTSSRNVVWDSLYHSVRVSVVLRGFSVLLW